MPGKPNEEGGRLRVEAEVLDVRKDDEVPALVAYAFSQSGRLLGRTELKEGRAEIPTPSTKEPETVRVVIGPRIDDEDEGKILSALVRLGAPERLIRPDQMREVLRFPVDRDLWWCWLRFCVARGTLLKRVTTGGLPVDMPVCGAEIEVYEVDPVSVIFPKIPDLVLERIRDLVRKPWPPPPPEERFPGGIPFPPVPPGPGPDPAPFLGGARPVRRAPLRATGPRRVGTMFLREEILSVVAELRGSEGNHSEMARSGRPRIRHRIMSSTSRPASPPR